MFLNGRDMAPVCGSLFAILSGVLTGCSSHPPPVNPVTTVRVIATDAAGRRTECTGFVLDKERIATCGFAVYRAATAQVILNGTTYTTSGRTLAHSMEGVSLVAVNWESHAPPGATLVQRSDLVSEPVTMPAAPRANQEPVVGSGRVRSVERRVIQITPKDAFTFGALLGAPVIERSGGVVGMVTQTNVGFTLGVGAYSSVKATRSGEIALLTRNVVVPWGSELPPPRK
jgi:sporulation protein YlmC with PRC-barrel domain